MTQAYPLQWPIGRPRTEQRKTSAFKVSPRKAYLEMVGELFRFGPPLIVSSNVPLRQSDGTPYTDGLSDKIADPGVAVYFVRKGCAVCIACDTYERPFENMRAIGLSVKAMRDMARWGADQILDQAFEGFAALPPPGSQAPASSGWWVILGVTPSATEEQIRAAYKAKARAGGGASVELNAARDAGLLAARGAA